MYGECENAVWLFEWEMNVFGTAFIRGVTNSHCHSGKQRNDASKSDCFKDSFCCKALADCVVWNDYLRSIKLFLRA